MASVGRRRQAAHVVAGATGRRRQLHALHDAARPACRQHRAPRQLDKRRRRRRLGEHRREEGRHAEGVRLAGGRRRRRHPDDLQVKVVVVLRVRRLDRRVGHDGGRRLARLLARRPAAPRRDVVHQQVRHERRRRRRGTADDLRRRAVLVERAVHLVERLYVGVDGRVAPARRVATDRHPADEARPRRLPPRPRALVRTQLNHGQRRHKDILRRTAALEQLGWKRTTNIPIIYVHRDTRIGKIKTSKILETRRYL